MKIGILYICTGKYDIFWRDFYLSSEKYFMTWHEIHYFVYTDALEIFDERVNSRIHKIFQKNLPWPEVTLMRFDMFIKSEKILSDMDYLYFFNADLEFKQPIVDNIFLPPISKELVATLHPWYFNKSRKTYPYENNSFSTAYIDKFSWVSYFAWWLMGWRTVNFLAACKHIHNNILLDIKNNIVAKWHDESHWNNYLVWRVDVHVLSPSFLYPEKSKLKIDRYIVIRDKRYMPWFWDYYFQQWRSLPWTVKFLSFFWK